MDNLLLSKNRVSVFQKFFGCSCAAFICVVPAPQSITQKCIGERMRGREDLMRFKLSIRMREKGDLSDFECSMVEYLGNYRSIDLQRKIWKGENIQWAAVLWVKFSCRCQKSEENGLLWKAAVTLITSWGMQRSVSEYTGLWILKQMDHSNSRPLLSVKNRKLRLV